MRVIAATHRDLETMVRAGKFREDLLYRINVFSIHLPPLRQRRADIVELANHFAARAGKRLGSPHLHVEAADLVLLQSYDWPGNVRELAAVIERAAILGEGIKLDISRALGVPSKQRPHNQRHGDPKGELDPFPTLDEAMRDHIERALVRARGKVEGEDGAAKLLGIHANTLRSRMHRLGVRWERFPPRSGRPSRAPEISGMTRPCPSYASTLS